MLCTVCKLCSALSCSSAINCDKLWRTALHKPLVISLCWTSFVYGPGSPDNIEDEKAERDAIQWAAEKVLGMGSSHQLGNTGHHHLARISSRLADRDPAALAGAIPQALPFPSTELSFSIPGGQACVSSNERFAASCQRIWQQDKAWLFGRIRRQRIGCSYCAELIEHTLYPAIAYNMSKMLSILVMNLWIASSGQLFRRTH